MTLVKRFIKQYAVGRSLIRYFQNFGPSTRTLPQVSFEGVYVISFPGSGRTWLHALIHKALTLYYEVDCENPLDSSEWIESIPKESRIKTLHDDHPHRKTPEELAVSKSFFKGRRVIFLVRDPRDVAVSNYFRRTHRKRSYDGDISSFIRLRRGSLETNIRYYLIWHENRSLPSSFMVLRYEDLHQRPETHLRETLRFLGLEIREDRILSEAIDACSYENMRKMEIANVSGLLPGREWDDPESFKVRRGRIGGFHDYLSESDIAYISQRINVQLKDLFGYAQG